MHSPPVGVADPPGHVAFLIGGALQYYTITSHFYFKRMNWQVMEARLARTCVRRMHQEPCILFLVGVPYRYYTCAVVG